MPDRLAKVRSRTGAHHSPQRGDRGIPELLQSLLLLQTTALMHDAHAESAGRQFGLLLMNGNSGSMLLTFVCWHDLQIIQSAAFEDFRGCGVVCGNSQLTGTSIADYAPATGAAAAQSGIQVKLESFAKWCRLFGFDDLKRLVLLVCATLAADSTVIVGTIRR
jgi:hypothetical protein